MEQELVDNKANNTQGQEITAEEQADSAQLMYSSAVDVVEDASKIEKEVT